jgi:hypothetical protein
MEKPAFAEVDMNRTRTIRPEATLTVRGHMTPCGQVVGECQPLSNSNSWSEALSAASHGASVGARETARSSPSENHRGPACSACTRAMAAGVTDLLWEVSDLVALLEAEERGLERAA